MGDIVRNEIKNKTEFAITMQTYLDKGDLVPDSLVCDLFSNFFNQIDKNKNLILDGFPRTLFQCNYLQDIVKNIYESIIVLFIDVPDKVLVERLLKRKRSDDTKDVIINRLETLKEIEPIKDFYSSSLRNINGNLDLNQISQSIIKEIN